ncbi:CoA transferase [Microbacterium yannicii]|uniref:CoA transferase n=1 Tax=Microbacterium yannicii TaxID=671622 RepID=UPI0002EF757B|nr:CoA transferase [Microbacterium yannicii]
MSLGAVGEEFAKTVGVPPDYLDLVPPAHGGSPWASQLPVGTLAADSVALASLAVNAASAERFGVDVAPVRVNRSRMAASFGSERVLRVNGEAPSVWAPLSGFWMAADGWVRTHANYPHHERALRVLLGVEGAAGKPEVAAAIQGWSAVELEDAAAQFGAVVGAVRTADRWREHPHGRIVDQAPLVQRTRFDGAAPRGWTPGDAPLSGVRVLDLTRVIAGPIAARDLAFAGAEVLRVDSPALEETGWIHLDTGQGKRSTLLDLRERADAETFDALLSRADVVVTGYRPGSLSRFGLDPESLADRHPGLVTASVSAWGTTGRWAGRRGFDSIVQAVSGIAMTESADGFTPGALPVQALDHSTGHFLASAIVLALVEQRRVGGSIDVQMSLARTAKALLTSTDDVEDAAPDVVLPFVERQFTDGRLSSLTYAPPVLAFTGAPSDYQRVGGRWGVDEAEWAS